MLFNPLLHRLVPVPYHGGVDGNAVQNVLPGERADVIRKLEVGHDAAGCNHRDVVAQAQKLGSSRNQDSLHLG